MAPFCRSLLPVASVVDIQGQSASRLTEGENYNPLKCRLSRQLGANDAEETKRFLLTSKQLKFLFRKTRNLDSSLFHDNLLQNARRFRP